MRHAPTPNARTAAAALFAACALTLFALPAIATDDNQGDIKVHSPDGTGEPANEPHVGCSFFIEGFNMEAASGTLVIRSWPPTNEGNTTVVLNTTWTADDQEVEGHHFLAGPFTLAAGHYKVFASDVRHDKMKVFWVDCEGTSTETETGTGTETGTETGTTTGVATTTTAIPVFPTATALVLGSVGALGGAFLMLRRRL